MKRFDECELARVDWQANMILAYVCANKDTALQCPVDRALPEPILYFEKYDVSWRYGICIVLSWGDKLKRYKVEDDSNYDLDEERFSMRGYEGDSKAATFCKSYDNADIILGGNAILKDMDDTLTRWYKAAGTE